MRSAVLTALALIFAMPASEATADRYRQPMPYAAGIQAPERIGCYWYREREYCSRYCYWEVNGRRYCQEHEREAHSQAPYVTMYSYDAAPPMKLGAEPR